MRRGDVVGGVLGRAHPHTGDPPPVRSPPRRAHADPHGTVVEEERAHRLRGVTRQAPESGET